MKDKEILEEVHRKLESIHSFEDLFVNHHIQAVRSFIEEEWQKEDEIEAKLDKIERKERGQKANDQELVDQYNRNRKVEDHIVDVAEIERHRGLVIGEDGTVKEIL